ncbi:serine/threonine-protein kinase [Mycobacterium marinum]|uniref:serine/threonine-protein kinase n=1 Tax=Mycobacterium marinum TaxID=1781 RepID=UPI0023589DE6|nr:serine/threonine-protein kinase [Mycobacterium marinum]MDC8980501.1 serine/threonine-protein kinase [Mycobacterium marinum]MDC8998065.1 serine/threonine-protein kinase [Mycobacterium marinum]MDC9008805.1 serine/threonine-protein kinase [Mycobacterium marinum]
MLAAGTELRLDKQKWTVKGPLPGSDRGGFGTVYLVTDEQDSEAVAKLVDKIPAAQRELLMGESIQAAGHRNVIPVLDQGEHGSEWAIVMPRADMSLAGYLKSNPPPVSLDALLPILRDVADALADIHGKVVHRDLKPANILQLNGSWFLADFGIARYADAATSSDTHKDSFTVHFAAPEQWRLEHATAQTDVYAFGVIGYLLVEGRLPFLGPTRADLRQQHCNEAPPPLTGGTRRLRDLIVECLLKAPDARPTPAAIVERLKKIGDEPTIPGFAKLAELNAEEVGARAEALRVASVEDEQRTRREELHQAAAALFAPIGNELLEAIQDNAPSVNIVTGPRARGKLLLAQFRDATLSLDEPKPSPPAAGLPFTVISESQIVVTTVRPVRGYQGRSHSLWFCDAHEEGRFAWYELAFMRFAGGASHPVMEPYSLSALNSRICFQNVMGTEQIAWPVEEIDRFDLSEFLGRWLGWFAQAAAGTLSRPNMMPEKPSEGSWRR